MENDNVRWFYHSLQRLQAEAPWPRTILGTLILVLLVILSKTLLRRLFFHPLRHIPGPWIASFCEWHQFYTNIWLDGEWCKTYPEVHKKYRGYRILRNRGPLLWPGIENERK